MPISTKSMVCIPVLGKQAGRGCSDERAVGLG